MSLRKYIGYGVTAVLTLCAAAAPSIAAEVPQSVIDSAFYTYKNGGPTAPGLKPGMLITKDNVESFKDILNPATFDFIKKGDYEMQVGKTIDFTLHSKFIEATRKYGGSVAIGADGNLTNYVAGRPFPQDPDPNDPQAGTKLAWNFQYGRVWGDLGCINPFIWDYRDYETGKLQREINYNTFCLKRFAFRTVDPPLPEYEPNPEKLYRGIYVRVESPDDIRGTQLLIHKYKDDNKQSDLWLDLGFQRRVRRFPTGQTTDSFLGTDLMIEDFEGYNGRISDYTWTYKGTKNLMTAFWDRNDVKNKGKQHTFKEADGKTWEFTSFNGKGQCHIDAPFQLRKTYILEGRPKDPSHPISKRVIYMDAETAEMPISEIYDRKGELWKQFVIGWSHPDKGSPDMDKGTGADIGDAVYMIDVQSRHCTTLSFHGLVSPTLVPDSTFSLQNMRGND
jgi:hypothetical protein